MKKIIIIFLVLFPSILFSQLDITKRNVTVIENFNKDGDTVLTASETRSVISDSIADNDSVNFAIYSDTSETLQGWDTSEIKNRLIAGGWNRDSTEDYLNDSNDFKLHTLRFDTLPVVPDLTKSITYWDTTNSTLVTALTDSILYYHGQSFYYYTRNATNTTLLPGDVVYIESSVNGSVIGSYKRAISNNIQISEVTVAVIAERIEPNKNGFSVGKGVVLMDLTGYALDTLIYLSEVDSSQIVDYVPNSPNYKVRIGKVLQTGVNGILGVDVSPFNGNDTEIAINGVLNGIITRKQAIRDTIISNVLYFETYNEDYPTSDLPFMFNKKHYLLNTTSNTGTNGYARVQLTYGTSSNALPNYIYIDNSTSTPTLMSSTVGIPISGIPHTVCGVFDQATHAAKSFAWIQRFNNAPESSPARGWFYVSGNRTRKEGSIYDTGIDPTVTIVTMPTIDSLYVSTTSGTADQFNPQTFAEQDGHTYIWFNHPNGDTVITDLSEIDIASDGTTFRNNNDRYNLTVFGIVSSGDYIDKLGVTTSTNKYTDDNSAIDDVNGYAVTNVPKKYGQTAMRLFRIPLKYITANGGTISNLLGPGGYIDERGYPLGTVGSGGGAGGALTNFSDAVFYKYNSADPTKRVNYDVSNVTTGTIRTLTIPDQSDTIALLSDKDKLNYWKLDIDSLTSPMSVNVGIGTESPLAALHLSGLGDYPFIFEPSSANGGMKFVNAGVDKASIRLAGSGAGLSFQTGGVTTSFRRLQISDDGTFYFNPQKDDLNFRVDGNTNNYTFWIDGNTEHIGVGTNTPQVPLHLEYSRSSTAISDMYGFALTNADGTTNTGSVIMGGGAIGTTTMARLAFINEDLTGASEDVVLKFCPLKNGSLLESNPFYWGGDSVVWPVNNVRKMWLYSDGLHVSGSMSVYNNSNHIKLFDTDNSNYEWNIEVNSSEFKIKDIDGEADRFKIETDGDVILDNNIYADTFKYNSAKTDYLTIRASGLTARYPYLDTVTITSTLSAGEDNVSIYGNVSLPHGATVTSVIMYGNVAAQAQTYYLVRYPVDGFSSQTMASANVNTADNTISYSIIDNANYSYDIQVSIDDGDAIYSVKITYTLTEL